MKKHIITEIIFIPLIIILIQSCESKKESEQPSRVYENEIFNETHRPQFHFSPPTQWMNDPNGMVFHQGIYHLFYQHYPDSNVWGPMHWGHAVSRDLIHWEHKPIALFPDEHGYIFSGSAVADVNNTSGLGSSDNPPLVAIFTYHDPEGNKADRNDFQTQGIAYSLDGGDTWKKYEKNPVLDNPGIRDFRDPKVIRYEPGDNWIMVLAVSDHVSFYSSDDLINWKFESDFGDSFGAHGGVWECPDLIRIDDPAGTDKWLLLVSINPGGPNGGSATQYFVGEFNGNSFLPLDSIQRWVDYGADNYAGVTWANIQDRKVFLGWMSNWLYATVVPTGKWRSAMTLPRELKLLHESGAYYLAFTPVKEYENIRSGIYDIKEKKIKEPLIVNAISGLEDGLFEIDMRIDSPSDVKIEVGNKLGEKIVIGYLREEQKYYIDRTKSGKTNFNDQFSAIHYAPRISRNKELEMKLIFDVASIELFADQGLTVMTDIFFPSEEYSQIHIIPEEETNFNYLKILDIESIW